MADLNATPSAERTRIGFAGLANVGKSSLVNAVTGQDLAVVSDVRGTTTDPVKKAMEILPLGPVVIVDTPGIDDTGELGRKRVAKAFEALRSCDAVVLVSEAGRDLAPEELDLMGRLGQRGVPVVVARNKADLLAGGGADGKAKDPADAQKAQADARQPREVLVSAKTGQGVWELKELLGHLAKSGEKPRALVSDLVGAGDLVVLVMPQDASAPKGRLILPQQMVTRDLLDAHAVAVSCQPEELPEVLGSLSRPPALVITDSQAFARVSADVPAAVPLTSFSILMARYKGELAAFMGGAAALRGLADGDRVLISEGCTHHRQCEDIGTVKLPAWIRSFSGAEPVFSFTSGGEFPDAEGLRQFRLVVHCGGCMLNAREVASRAEACRAAGVPVVNYGIAIAAMNGILDRSVAPLGLA